MSSLILKVILIYGGKSVEHEISLFSAASVLSNLNREKYEIIPVAIDKTGCFFVNDYNELLKFKDKLPVKTFKSKVLSSFMKNGNLFIDADVVFPIIHGSFYEDGSLQGLLELSGVAYVGSNVKSSSISMDKDLTRRIVCDNVIKCARYKVISFRTNLRERVILCKKLISELNFPLFVKPCSLGSSIGVKKVENFDQLIFAINNAFNYDENVIIEEYIFGREIEIAVLENRFSINPIVSVPGEIYVNHPDGFYSYSAKYLDTDHIRLCIPANLNYKLIKKIQYFAKKIFVRLKCNGMARIDFFITNKNEEIYFNEINTIPGFTKVSMYPKMWEMSGLCYTKLLDELIKLAIIKKNNSNRLIRS
ncbi:D-alanine--D-alanine ligase [Candidatus Legionella polyplacis]|uniref:D-alanine--D-alanine ligase family protein n=1 Tax=Candidatus Legionella polyplacis TaxID=2005262 RepID=UPI000C1E2F65|nr:D-alanine--D-alanine ligase family protein [Candidatus Legionella polyplacis]ATW01782.1 D-alanine--D-alanine ligase [Candidatus Legionella polyplacis]